MNKIGILIMVLLGCGCTSGCVPYIPTKYDYAIYIGDSDCDPDFDREHLSGAELAGIPTDCFRGDRIIDYGDQLPDKNPIFLALGKNDRSTPIEEYTAKLQTLLDSTSNDVYCVLPSIPNSSLDEIRAAMTATCTNIIDTADYITEFTDGVHYGDQSKFGVYLESLVMGYQ